MSVQTYQWSKYRKGLVVERRLKSSPHSQVDLVRDPELGVRYIYRVNQGSADVYRSLLHLRCEHLPRVLDVWEADGNTYVIEEYVAGDRLDTLLEAGPLTAEQAHSVTVQICDALSALHSVGAVHRDVKPENILICGETAVLIDFDASRLCKNDRQTDTRIMGTNGYAAPEQYGFSQTDARTDLYALGIVFNEMLTGKHPAIRLADKPYRAVVETCTAVNAERRYASAGELKAALNGLRPSSKRIIRICAAAAVLAAVLLCGVLLGRMKQEPPAAIAVQSGKPSDETVAAEESRLSAAPAAAEEAPAEAVEKEAKAKEDEAAEAEAKEAKAAQAEATDVEATEAETAEAEAAGAETVETEAAAQTQELILCAGEYCGDCYTEKAANLPDQKNYIVFYRITDDGQYEPLNGQWKKEMDEGLGHLVSLSSGVNIWDTSGVLPGTEGVITLRKEDRVLRVPAVILAEPPESDESGNEDFELAMRHSFGEMPTQKRIYADPGAMTCYFFRQKNGQLFLLDDSYTFHTGNARFTISSNHDGSYFLEFERVPPDAHGVLTAVRDGKEYTIPYDIVKPD